MNSQKLLSAVRTSAAILVLLIVALNANAGVSVSITNGSVSAKRGDVVTIQGTVQNTGASTVYVNGDSLGATLKGVAIQPVRFDLFVDDSPFAKGSPTTLTPGQQWSGNLCQITIGIDSPSQTYALSFSATGGADATQLGSLGSGAFSLTVTENSPDGPPTAPVALTGTVPSISQVNLSWVDFAGDADSFSVERSSDGGATWTVLATVYSNQTSFTDTTAQASGSYTYRVRARNSFSGGAYSPYSNLFSVINFAGAGANGVGVGLTGSYYNDAQTSPTPHYVGSPALVEVDPTINFAWNGTPPGPGVGGVYFSVKWVGYVQPQYTGSYTFYTDTDDGAALFVNGTQLVNDPTYHGVTEHSGSIQLTAGQFYPIEMDYFQGTGGDAAQLFWSSANVPKQIIPQANLSTVAGTNPPANFTATGVSASRIDLSWNAVTGPQLGYILQRKQGTNGTYSTLAFLGAGILSYSDTQLSRGVNYVYRIQALNSSYSNEANAAPLGPPLAPTSLLATALSASQLSLSWIDPSGGAAVFLVERSSDGGNSWAQLQTVAASTPAYVDTTTAPNSTYEYRVRTMNGYQGGSYSQYTNIFTITTPSVGGLATGDGLLANYYTDTTSHLSGTPALTRVDPTINFSYNPGTPGQSVTVDGTNFSARWTGSVVAASTETYTFYTESDDGVMLYINGNLLLSNWTTHASTENTGTIALTAGQAYKIELDYFQGGGPGVIQLLWSTPTITKQTVPQSQLYSGTGLSTPGNFAATSRTGSSIQLNWSSTPQNAAGYVIQRQDGFGAPFQQVAALGASTTSLRDIGLAPGTQYIYQIEAYNPGGTSPAAIVTTATLPSPPTSLSATASSGKATLAWTAATYNGNPTDQTFKIYRGTSSGGETPLLSGLAAPAYTDTGLQDGTTYYYTVSAVDLGGEGPASSEASALPHYTLSDFLTAYRVSDLSATNAGGVSNLEAYALNLNPLQANAGNLPSGKVVNGFLTLTFTFRPAASDLTYNVQVSPDLQNWYSGTNYVTMSSVTPIDGDTESVTFQSNVPVSSEAQQFIRLQIIH